MYHKRGLTEMKTKRLWPLIVFLLGAQGCVESTFTLSRESRLPTWLVLPTNVPRDRVVILLEYRTLGDAELSLWDDRGTRLARVACQVSWPSGTEGALSLPKYVVLTSSGKSELIELEAASTFSVSNARLPP